MSTETIENSKHKNYVKILQGDKREQGENSF